MVALRSLISRHAESFSSVVLSHSSASSQTQRLAASAPLFDICNHAHVNDAPETRRSAIHPTAVIEEGVTLGKGVAIWHFAHVRAGARIGAGTSIGKSSYVDSGAVIGAGCKIQNFVSVYRGVELEDEVFVGPSVTFTNDRHPRAAGEWELVPTFVRRGASLGANATVVCGVTIGEWSSVGAGSVVVRDVEPHRLVVGNPAEPIGWVCRCGHGVPGGLGGVCPACGTTLEL
jgi:UDP-2-acetamido-3-amino-2,3-dideoxy-glucuronate N-acetyltransferase